MEKVEVGKLITGDQQRDAIHVAIAPVVAHEKLWPGQDIGFVAGSSERVAIPSADNGVSPIGVVDPFLKGVVYPEARFYLFLYPNTVTSLRHEWVHPAFGAASEPENHKTDSEVWLRAYAMRVNTYDTPQEAFDRMLEGLRSRTYFAHGTDCHGFFDVDDAADLKFHGERFLGIQIDWGGFEFSCSC